MTQEIIVRCISDALTKCILETVSAGGVQRRERKAFSLE